MEWKRAGIENPEHDCFVDVYLRSTHNSTYGERQTDIRFDGEKFHHKQGYSCVFVSHWMPIPAPPEAG